MRSFRMGVALVLTLVAAVSVTANELDILGELRDQLRYVRALDAGAPVDMSCPEKASLLHLHGLKKSEVLDQLSEPDFEEEEADVSSWSYFLTSPEEGVVAKDGTLQLSTGGGFPIVTFIFNPQEVVERVTCAYAR